MGALATIMLGAATLLQPAPVGWPDLAQPSAVQGGGERDAAVVVGVGKYLFVPPVAGATQNADDWYAYLARTRRVPPARLTLLRDNDATLESLRRHAAAAARQVEPGGTLWFVFIGHGAPSKDGSDGVLVGVDTQQNADSLYARGLAQRELIALLEKGGRQARTVVVLDACFSGRSSGGSALVPGLQPLLPVAERPEFERPLALLTAAASDQFAGPLPKLGRPAFSYLVLGALRGWGDRDGDGRVTAIEAVGYAREALATVVKTRSQRPALNGDGSLALAAKAQERGPDLVALVLGRRAAPSAPPALPPAAPPRPGTVSDEVFAVTLRGDEPSLGDPARALVTLVVFNDFECPYCGKLAQLLPSLRAHYGADLRIVFKNLPLKFHRRALPAAEAAMCAHQQQGFWPVHDRLYRDRKQLTRADFERHVAQAGLSLQLWRACVEGDEVLADIQRDMAQAEKIGARGTPTTFINGSRIVGARPAEQFRAVIDAQLERARGLVKRGIPVRKLYRYISEGKR